jgi:hypothetical protein
MLQLLELLLGYKGWVDRSAMPEVRWSYTSERRGRCTLYHQEVTCKNRIVSLEFRSPTRKEQLSKS